MNFYKITPFLVLILIIILVFYTVEPQCDGTKKWSKYTGKLEYIYMNTDICCHVNCYFKLNNTDRIYFFNWDKNILNSVDIGNTYTFYLEPHPEPSATTAGKCSWVQVIYKITDANNNIVWRK